MTITLGLWAIPLLATVSVWAWAILMPMPRPQGAFDIGGLLTVGFRAFVVMVVSLVSGIVRAMVR